MSQLSLRHIRSIVCALAATLFSGNAALAHTGESVRPENVWSSWNFDPLILIGVTASAVLYSAGVRHLWLKAGIGTGVSRVQTAAFGCGLLALLMALVSPLDPLGEALFAAHMVQHLVLILIAAPLLVYGAPLAPVLIGLPRSWRRPASTWARHRVVRPLWRAVSHPLFVWMLNAVLLWLWHMPSLYQAAIRNEAVHALEHASFLGVALLFWWTLIQPIGRRTLPLGLGVIFVFTTGVQSSALGALLTFAPTPWYPVHITGVNDWGTTLLQDQQLAGLLMWVPAGVVYLVAALATFTIWLRSMDPPDVAGISTTRMLDSDAGTDRSHLPRSG